MKVIARLLPLLKSLGQETADPRRLGKVLASRVEPPPQGRSPRGLVLGTSTLLYRWLDLSALPKGRRKAAAAAQLRAWSPFERNDFRVVWFGESAGLFAWDPDRLTRRLADAGVNVSAELPVVPEPYLYLPATAFEGIRLCQHSEGYAGEIWTKGAMRHLRWWPELPTAEEWSKFLRGSGLPPSTEVPLPVAPEREISEGKGTKPFKLFSESALRNSGTGWDTAAAMAVSLVLMGWTAFLTADQLHLKRQQDEAQSRLDQIKAKSGPVVAAREDALRELANANQLVGMLQGPRALAVTEHLLVRLAPVPGLVLRQMDLNGRQLRVTLDVPASLERARIVTALEEGGWFTDVRESRESTANLITLTMNLNGDQPQVAATVSSPAASAATIGAPSQLPPVAAGATK